MDKPLSAAQPNPKPQVQHQRNGHAKDFRKRRGQADAGGAEAEDSAENEHRRHIEHPFSENGQRKGRPLAPASLEDRDTQIRNGGQRCRITDDV